MKYSSYDKVLGFISLLGLLFICIFSLISTFVTHADQPAVYGSMSSLVTIALSCIITGILQLHSTRKNGQLLAWYKQYQITLGLSVLCLSSAFILVGLFSITLFSYGSQVLPEIGIILLMVCALLSFIFLMLCAKYRSQATQTANPPVFKD